MTIDKIIKKIKIYSTLSFLLPLIALNSCLLIYKFLGDTKPFPNFDWSQKNIVIPYDEYNYKVYNYKSHSFINCPKTLKKINIINADNETIPWIVGNDPLITNLLIEKKVKFVSINNDNKIDLTCSKHYPIFYYILKTFNSLESRIVKDLNKNLINFSKIKNPYLYGEVSISRTARDFPTVFIFKPLVILSAFLLFFYWLNNLRLFNQLKNNGNIVKFSYTFFYLGSLSCVFLMLHAIFLGVDFGSEFFIKIRRIIIILFIFFEISAQFFLTKNLYRYKKNIKQFFFPSILNLKILFVILMLFVTIISLAYLSFGDAQTSFKHILEWNYFTVLLIFYLLSRLLWK